MSHDVCAQYKFLPLECNKTSSTGSYFSYLSIQQKSCDATFQNQRKSFFSDDMKYSLKSDKPINLIENHIILQYNRKQLKKVRLTYFQDQT